MHTTDDVDMNRPPRSYDEFWINHQLMVGAYLQPNCSMDY